MREILFRAQHYYRGEWIAGYPHTQGEAWVLTEPGPDGHTRLIDPETISEWTGLRDKDRNRIFEGDILEAHFDEAAPEETSWYLVEWREDRQEGIGWYIQMLGEYPVNQDPLERDEPSPWTVIGNRWDNPELLGSLKGPGDWSGK